MYYDKRIETEAESFVQRPELTAVQQHCLEAAEYIRRHGWCRGVWQVKEITCMMGAVAMVIEGAVSRRSPLYVEALDHLQKRIGFDPVTWNDRPGRTKEDVIDLLERVGEGR